MTDYKFKVPRKPDFASCHITAQYLTNGHWLFNTQWLEACGASARSVKTLLKKIRVERVTARLRGEEITDYASRIDGIIPSHTRICTDYMPADCTPDAGPLFEQGKPAQEGLSIDHVLLKIKGEVKSAINVKYCAALSFCPDTRVLVNTADKTAPIVHINEERVVGLIMPVRIPEGSQ